MSRAKGAAAWQGKVRRLQQTLRDWGVDVGVEGNRVGDAGLVVAVYLGKVRVKELTQVGVGDEAATALWRRVWLWMTDPAGLDPAGNGFPVPGRLAGKARQN
jgi:hypothetical protein